MSTTFCPGVLQDIHDEHERLDLFFSEIQQALLPPGLTRPLVVAGLMAELAELLQTHFAHEEQGGYFAEIIEARPLLADMVERLRQQHRNLLRDVRAMHSRLVHANGAQVGSATIRADFLEFVRRCNEHQHAEDGLVQEAYCQDIGTCD